MFNTLDKIEKDFSNSLENIVSFMDCVDIIKSLDCESMKKSKYYNNIKNSFVKLQSKLLDSQIVQYNAIIISLYGAYELAIKNSTNSFIKYCINYNLNLSDNYIKNYLSSVAKSFERNSKKENFNLIKDLNNFLINGDITKFRTDLSLNSKQNLKSSVVQEIANLIGKNSFLNETKYSLAFENYIKNRENFSTLEQTRTYINALKQPYKYIDDIVDSRNRIAHRGYEEEPMLDSNILRQIVFPEFRLFVSSYIKFLKIQWCIQCCTTNTNVLELKVINIFNNNIICFNTKENIVTRDGIIIIKKAKDKWEFSTILNIQYNNQDIEISEVNQNIGCKLEAHCKPNYKYYLYNSKNK